MSKILRDLLDAEEPIFSLSLRQLEQSSNHPGEDAKLIGEIAAKLRAKTEALGLDPAHTSGPELYQALKARVHDDNVRVTKLVGGHDPSDVKAMIPKLVKAVEGMKIDRRVWVMKRSVAKKFLKQMPPKQLMAHLGHKTVDSLLKHEDIDEIYPALRFSEGGEWLERYNGLLKSLKPSDFETRDIKIVVMNHDKYVDLAEKFVRKKFHNITHTKEMGIIVVVPMHADKMTGITLKSLPLMFHYINEIRLYSSFFKLKQVEKKFGQVVVDTLNADPGNASQMAGQNVHWRVIQRYFGKIKDEAHPEAFEPHVHPEDLHWRKAEEWLAELDPEMKFWLDLDYVGAMMNDGNPLTLNLMDVSLSYSNELDYDQRYFYHFRESLWNEIFMRYMGQANLEDQILKQLDNDMIAPEKLKLPKLSPAEQTELKQRKSHVLVRQKLIDAAEGRLISVTDEFEHAFSILEKYEKTVTVFGSARLSEDDPAYKGAYNIGSALAAHGYCVVTGGGYGIMEAANKGAFESGGDSIGFNIQLPTEQKLNDYTTDHYSFEHFFGRKVTMTLQSNAYVYCPGGFGTLDELFEIVTLEQTGKIPRVPIILYGSKFWQPLKKFIDQILNERFHTIEAADEKLLTICDDVDEIVRLIDNHKSDVKKAPKGSQPKARKPTKPKAKSKTKT
ncbi:MAG TPA: TIGR00730 family Rossman fold protein [Candidatus Saccharimonadales bacterium]|nr:TIGR00730 family Rossman fold protein [Candidatus Saccharimonadales bacterium]